MGISFRVGLWALIGVAVVSATALTYRHYSDLVDSKVALTSSVVALEKEVAQEKARAEAYSLAVGAWAKAAEVQAKALSDNTTAQLKAGAYARELSNAISKHNLGALAESKPGLIERRVNTGTDRAFRLLEHASEIPSRDQPASTGASKP